MGAYVVPVRGKFDRNAVCRSFAERHEDCKMSGSDFGMVVTSIATHSSSAFSALPLQNSHSSQEKKKKWLCSCENFQLGMNIYGPCIYNIIAIRQNVIGSDLTGHWEQREGEEFRADRDGPAVITVCQVGALRFQGAFCLTGTLRRVSWYGWSCSPCKVSKQQQQQKSQCVLYFLLLSRGSVWVINK